MSEYATLHTMPTTTLFPQFAAAQEAADRVAVENGHRVHWTIWGSTPRCGNAVCERCGRSLLIQKTRTGAFRLEGSALQDCFQPARELSIA